MPRYRVRRTYRAGPLVLTRGEIVELEDDRAAHLERDSPGLLEPVAAAGEGEVRDLREPPADRMRRRPASRRGGDHTRGG